MRDLGASVNPTVFKLRRWNDVALVTLDNGEDWTKPTILGRTALESLAACLDELERQEWRALVLTGKPFVFAAGADIGAFSGATAETAAAGSRAGHELFARLAALPFPTVAAINGACLGGGVELALHCSARTISTAVRHFAAPECFLGIFPAWGGTQLVPRLVGAQTAVRFVVENAMERNRMLDGRTAFELGFAERLLEPVELVDESIAFALELADAGGIEREPVDLSDLPEVVTKARRRLDDAVHGAAPAPYEALDLLEGAGRWSLEEGYRAEEEAIARLLPGDAAQASVYAFELVELRKRQPGLPDAEPRTIRKVGIVGAGLMATQLAQLFLRRLEVPVAIRDVDAARVEEALDTLRSTARKPFHATLVSGGTGWDGFADCDLVLEAVFEELEVKREVFTALEQIVRPDCVLATNTSSLSVAAMAEPLAHPERLVGMHFFNPVAVMPLVELIRHDASDDTTLATAAAVVRTLRKRGVLCADAPGFVVNRVLTRMTGELMAALERGNTVEETDDAILRLGMPMAPSVLLQMVGPRVANHVLETMHAAYPDRFPLSTTLASYAAGREEIAVREHDPLAVEAITDAVLAALADEIGHLLDEGVVASAADVDTCLLLGAGFPFWLGGITKHLDQRGVSQRVLGRTLGAAPAAAATA
jgi:3-hydroxyacyl-CoA dehydrogenase/enoyl-CoA hydratase/carnithine racemase